MTTSSNSILFSIAIPAYKAVFLHDCIESILEQSYPFFELIIINDNSPHDLDSIVNSFNDDRIKYYTNAIGFGEYNVSRNWDECLKHANGDYFLCLGDDDRLLPNCLESYYRLIADYPDCKVFHIRTQIIDEHSNVYNLQEARPPIESALSMIWHRWCAGGRRSWIGDYLFDTRSLKDLGGFIWFPYAWGTEEATVYKLASLAGIANSQDYGFQYRVNRQSITFSTANLIGKADSFIPYRDWFQQFLSECPDFESSDSIYREIILNRFDSYFSDSICMVIRDDTRYNHFRNLHYWIHNRKKYHLSLKQVIKSQFVGLRQLRRR